jgi:hypothetical protein
MGLTIKAVVIAGLDPAIHRAKRNFEFLMDARVKPGHDELGTRP